MAKVNIDWHIASLYIKSGNHSNIRRYLMKAGIVQVKDLCKMKEEELTKIPYMVGKNLQAIKDTLKHFGLRLGMTDGDLTEYEMDYWSGNR